MRVMTLLSHGSSSTIRSSWRNFVSANGLRVIISTLSVLLLDFVSANNNSGRLKISAASSTDYLSFPCDDNSSYITVSTLIEDCCSCGQSAVREARSSDRLQGCFRKCLDSYGQVIDIQKTGWLDWQPAKYPWMEGLQWLFWEQPPASYRVYLCKEELPTSQKWGVAMAYFCGGGLFCGSCGGFFNCFEFGNAFSPFCGTILGTISGVSGAYCI